MSTHTSVHMCIHAHVDTHVHAHVYTYVYTHAHANVYTHAYTHIHVSRHMSARHVVSISSYYYYHDVANVIAAAGIEGDDETAQSRPTERLMHRYIYGSYRDPECAQTLHELFGKAARPARVFIGLLQQNNFSADADWSVQHGYAHICTYVYAHMHKHVHTDIHAHVHTQVHAHVHAHIYTHVYTNVRAHIYTHLYTQCTRLCTCLYTHPCTYLYPCLCTCLYTCLCPYLCTALPTSAHITRRASKTTSALREWTTSTRRARRMAAGYSRARPMLRHMC